MNIEKANIKIIMDNKQNSSVYHHIMFENIDFKKESVNHYYYELTDALNLSVSYGMYNLYYFGLSNKSETSLNVTHYSYLKNIKVNKDKNISLEILELKPCYSSDFENNNAAIMINMNNIYEFFGLSSVSVKQGGDRYRSCSFEYDNDLESYIIVIPIQYYGDWYINISYCLKYKFDNNISLNENINLSTSYFPDNFLGSLLQ